jgi:hypothetical protein
MISRTFRITLLTCSLAGMLCGQAIAQDAPVQFRMVAAKGNPSACMPLDASMSRVHTVTVMGDKAVLKSSGGINDNMKQTTPGVYKTTFSLSGARLDIVVDASKTPKTLEAVEPKLGCRWNAVAP